MSLLPCSRFYQLVSISQVTSYSSHLPSQDSTNSRLISSLNSQQQQKQLAIAAAPLLIASPQAAQKTPSPIDLLLLRIMAISRTMQRTPLICYSSTGHCLASAVETLLVSRTLPINGCTCRNTVRIGVTQQLYTL
jgi:hypothetical protein